MNRLSMHLRIFVATLWLAGVVPIALADEQVKHGEYVFKVAGCLACHTDTKEGAKPLAGGHALKTPFGVFYSPNVTPHPSMASAAGRLRIFALRCARALERMAATTTLCFRTPVTRK